MIVADSLYIRNEDILVMYSYDLKSHTNFWPITKDVTERYYKIVIKNGTKIDVTEKVYNDLFSKLQQK